MGSSMVLTKKMMKINTLHLYQDDRTIKGYYLQYFFFSKVFCFFCVIIVLWSLIKKIYNK
jgi:hypothetical protein